MSNLQFIKEVTITTNQSQTLVENCFSSNYDAYKIVTRGISTFSSFQSDLSMRLIDSGGSVITQNEYDYAHNILRADAASTEQKATGQDKFLRAFAESTDKKPESNGGIVYVYNPANASSYTFISYQNMDAGSGLFIAVKGVGQHTVTEAITGFQLSEINNDRPYNSGKITVYGIKG